MVEKSVLPSQKTQPADWNAGEQNLLAATLLTTPAQRLAWLEEILHLAYASGALKPKRFISTTTFPLYCRERSA